MMAFIVKIYSLNLYSIKVQEEVKQYANARSLLITCAQWQREWKAGIENKELNQVVLYNKSMHVAFAFWRRGSIQLI